MNRHVEDQPKKSRRGFVLESLEFRHSIRRYSGLGRDTELTLPVNSGFRSRLDRLIVMNTVLAVGKPLDPHLYEWRNTIRKIPDLPVGQTIRR